MHDFAISVIIPTYNRKKILQKCIQALLSQAYPLLNYEVLVIDDGSTDGTEELTRSIKKKSLFDLRYFKQKNKGPAAARNLGISNAKGEIVLFIGDDIIARPNLLQQHIEFHSQFKSENIAILGYVTWSPELKVSPFMRWLENGGPQFSYYRIFKEQQVDYKYFYTSNISVKKKFLLKYGTFDEVFPYAAYEDSELGYRLHKKGLQLIFNKNAGAYHYHPTTVRKFCRRQEYAGKSAVLLAQKWPDEFSLEENYNKNNVLKYFKIKPKPAFVNMFRIAVDMIDRMNLPLPDFIYRFLTGYYFLTGIGKY